MTDEAVTRAGVGLRSERGPVLLAVMLSTGLVAIDATILATAVNAIVGDLGGFTQFPWLFSVYLLGQAVAVPIYGKIADLVGRKKVMLFGVGMFVLGSILCGSAWNMTALIAFRAIQGLGAGAVQPIGMTIIGDIYTVAERAKVQGYLAGVWAAASVIGPTLGGFFADYAGWRWIFWINIPLGAAAAIVLIRRFHENVTPTRHRIDYAGAGLLAVGSALLVLALLEGGTRWSWVSWESGLVLGGAAVALLAAVIVERRAAEPILPGWVLGERTQGPANLAALLVGVVLISLTTYIPLYGQSALRTSALVAGLALAALTMGWPVAAANAGRLYLRIGFRATALVGALVVTAGSASLLLLTATSSIWQVAASCFVTGIGLGLLAPSTMVALQSAVPWERRGVATGANMFARSLGSALGAAMAGALANAALAVPVGSTGIQPGMFTPEQISTAARTVFLGTTVAAAIAIGAVLLMPRGGAGKAERTTPEASPGRR
ncbi:MDR family MFS transporter [Enemella evansiae]|uniref:MDR family MFS transporter n=1 Tax=Enemella evansiae TaxID=2016499 RepID=UPI001E43A094|nr:MDR family MFS transporter [Enemella evansiae]